EKSAMPLTQAELDSHWSALADDKPAAAFQSYWPLVMSPDVSVAFLTKRLRPVAAPDAGRIEDLIKKLDSNQFAVRNQAVQELEKLEDLAEPGLRKTLGATPSLEVRRRLESLLSKFALPIAGAERLRAVRAVAVLEQI